jgi:hypothetical protein
VTARRVTGRAKQEESPPAVAGQHPPHDTKNCDALIAALQLHKIREAAVRQPHSFFNLAVMSLVLPDQQIRDPARIIETTSHKPSRDDGRLLAVESRPRANKVLMPAAGLLSAAAIREKP